LAEIGSRDRQPTLV